MTTLTRFILQFLITLLMKMNKNMNLNHNWNLQYNRSTKFLPQFEGESGFSREGVLNFKHETLNFKLP